MKNIKWYMISLAVILASASFSYIQFVRAAQPVIETYQGGTGTGVAPTIGQVLVGAADGTYAPQATSTLGISGGGASLSGGTNGYATIWNSPTSVTTGILLDNGTVSGVNATSSTNLFNIKGSGTLNPFNVSSSTGTSLFTVFGDGHVGIGDGAMDLSSTTAGGLNITIGASGLNLPTDSSNGSNIAIGKSSLAAFDGTFADSGQNVAIGDFTMQNLNHASDPGIGNRSTAVGYKAMQMFNYKGDNTAIGTQAMQNALGADNTTAIGSQALKSLSGTTTSGSIVAVGYNALTSITGATASVGDTCIGSSCGSTVVQGNYDTFIGGQAQSTQSGLAAPTTGVQQSIAIGYNSFASASHQLVFGHASSTLNGYINSIFMYGISTSSLMFASSTSQLVAYAGSSCGGSQFASSISAAGVLTCATPAGGSGSVSGGTTGYVATWASSTGLTSGILIDNGSVAGVNATSSSITFNLQGSSGSTNTLFNVASSSGTSYLSVSPGGVTTISNLTLGTPLTVANGGTGAATLPAAKAVFNITTSTITTINFVGNGSAITNGSTTTPIRINASSTVVGFSLLANASCSGAIDIWKANGSVPTSANRITAAAMPTLSSAQTNTSYTLTGWTTSFQPGDIIMAQASSSPTCVNMTLELEGLR